MKIRDLKGIVRGRVMVWDIETWELLGDAMQLSYLPEGLEDREVESMGANIDRQLVQKYPDAIYGVKAPITSIYVE